MRRPLGLLAVALALPCLARGAEPLDLDLSKLGAPTREAWQAIAARQGVTLSAADAEQLANEAKQRFAILSSELGMALSAAVLQPASTTGHAGWDFGFEAAYVQVNPALIGASPGPFPGFQPADPYPFRTSRRPEYLLLPSFHVRKALPWSVELGGRGIYLNQSLLFAVQGELKWAFVEGLLRWPDLAVRGAHTRLAGQASYDLHTTDVELLASKRFGFSGVLTLTPYAAGRWSFLHGETKSIAYGDADPATAAAVTAPFPSHDQQHWRATLGVRLTTAAVSMAVEGTYRFAASGGEPGYVEDDYPRYDVPSSLGLAVRFGFEY
jgi:hypothetical protein